LNRRRKIYEIAHHEGCNKIAYGHHKDDIVETLLINILFGRKIEAMCPVQEVFKGRMHVIRPLMYVEEALLKKFASESGLPDLPRPCPVDGHTRRQKVKDLIAALQKEEKNANITGNIFKSLSHINLKPEYFTPKKGPA
jgi:tRNA 2-thiocytidine biosynthesis protein TtcA